MHGDDEVNDTQYLTRDYRTALECILVVTDEVVQQSGADFSRFPTWQIEQRGKQKSVLAYAVRNPLEISADTPLPSPSM